MLLILVLLFKTCKSFVHYMWGGMAIAGHRWRVVFCHQMKLWCCLFDVSMSFGSHDHCCVRGIFLRGAKSFFLIFFPARNAFSWSKIPILVDPKQISVVLKSEKKKKKKKERKKEMRSSPNFVTFPPSSFNFPPYLFQVSFCSSPFSVFYLPCLFPVGQQKFPGEKYQGALCPSPLAAMPLLMIWLFILCIYVDVWKIN